MGYMRWVSIIATCWKCPSQWLTRRSDITG
jgi:hypothetical protein